MADLICNKTMMACQTPGMCMPHGGCSSNGFNERELLRMGFRQACEERDKLRAENERLRMQLVACGVVAMANTQESAAKARDMHPDYMSASCQDVMRAVDSEMALRAENEALRQIISDSATACGATTSTECTIEFMGHLPAEIAGVLRQLRAELERVKAQNENFADHMRALACRLGAGGYNAPEVDPDQFASKINGGIDMLVDPLVADLEQARADADRYRWLRERGDACQWMNITRVDPEDYDNLDAAIDAAMGKGGRADG